MPYPSWFWFVRSKPTLAEGSEPPFASGPEVCSRFNLAAVRRQDKRARRTRTRLPAAGPSLFRFAQQTVILFLDDAVALARACLHSCPVEDADRAPVGADQASLLQGRKYIRNARASRTQHNGQVLMAQAQL